MRMLPCFWAQREWFIIVVLFVTCSSAFSPSAGSFQSAQEPQHNSCRRCHFWQESCFSPLRNRIFRLLPARQFASWPASANIALASSRRGHLHGLGMQGHSVDGQGEGADKVQIQEQQPAGQPGRSGKREMNVQDIQVIVRVCTAAPPA
jgi:hypothetical protein